MPTVATTVSELLEQLNLGAYADSFMEEGWDELAQLRSVNEKNLDQLIVDVKMKSGHAARLRGALLNEPGTAPGAALPSATSTQPASAPAAQPATAQLPSAQPAVTQPASQLPPLFHATDEATTEQAKFVQKLGSRNGLGVLIHGSTIETFADPTLGPTIIIVSKKSFMCACCRVKKDGTRASGSNFFNVLQHMGSKEHWTNFQRRAYNMPFDVVGWLKYTGSNQHGPGRALLCKQNLKRKAESEVKKGLEAPTPPFTPASVTPGAAAPAPRHIWPTAGGCDYDASQETMQQPAYATAGWFDQETSSPVQFPATDLLGKDINFGFSAQAGVLSSH